jgi:hypothetical protein
VLLSGAATGVEDVVMAPNDFFNGLLAWIHHPITISGY